jgi:hypothetical protein
MADARTADPHESLWARLAHHRTSHTIQYRVVHLGYYSSLVLLALMILDMPFSGLFAGHYMAVGMIYIVLQLSEVLWRDALNWVEVTEGSAFAFVPAIVSLIVKILDWHSGYTMLNQTSLDVMNFWCLCAWISFVASYAFGLKMPTVSFRRQESGVPKS